MEEKIIRFLTISLPLKIGCQRLQHKFEPGFTLNFRVIEANAS
jgi:hypothetical protein